MKSVKRNCGIIYYDFFEGNQEDYLKSQKIPLSTFLIKSNGMQHMILFASLKTLKNQMIISMTMEETLEMLKKE